MFLPLAASAFTSETEIDGINYYIDTNVRTAEVRAKSPKYSGDIVIPSTVEYEGVTCNVTSIGISAFSGCEVLTSVSIGSSMTSIESYAFAYCQALEDVYCHAENVPSTNANAFYGSNIENSTLHVPAASVNAYQAAEPWKNFKNIVAWDGTTPEPQKCATPTISYVDGEIMFECETECVEYVSEIKASDANKYYDQKIVLTNKYIVSVYATKAGYEDSEVATKEISIEGGSGLKGDVNGDGEVGIGDIITITNIMAE